MYAIMQNGSKQYRVEEGDVIDVELLEGTSGDACTFKEVVFLQEASQSKIGLPFVEGCVVQGEILGEVKGPKVISFKIKRRKNCRKKIGHRQKYARVRITAIGASDKKPAAKKAAAPKVEAQAKPKAKPAAKKTATPKVEAQAKPKAKPAAKTTAPKAAAKKPAIKKKKES